MINIGISTNDPLRDDLRRITVTDERESAGAADILIAGADAIQALAAARDLEDGERTMVRAVTVFNAWRTTEGALTEAEGRIFMALLKLCRANGGAHHIDDYVDAAAYIALAGEHADRLDESAY